MDSTESNIEEVRLLRQVVKSIENITEHYPGVVPHSVMNEYNKVKDFYSKQLADEEYLMTTFHKPVPPDYN